MTSRLYTGRREREEATRTRARGCCGCVQTRALRERVLDCVALQSNTSTALMCAAAERAVPKKAKRLTSWQRRKQAAAGGGTAAEGKKPASEKPKTTMVLLQERCAAAKQASKDARERFRLKEATQPEDAQLVESYRLAKAALNDHLKEQEAARFEQLLSASGSSAEIDTKKRKVAATGDGKERVNSSGESQPPGKKPRAADDSSSGVASKKPSSEQGKKESNRSRRRRERRNEWNQQQGAQES